MAPSQEGLKLHRASLVESDCQSYLHILLLGWSVNRSQPWRSLIAGQVPTD